MKKGQISINTENILPIIKKWLYSEKEIFLRELVANASDAITKLEKIALSGEGPKELPTAKISITLDEKNKTLTIEDTGLGMTADEIDRYINQVAFSGVQDFVTKYQGKDDENQIIGHFGLGFYSSFMVAQKVEIETLSYQEGAEAAHWICDGSTEFEISPSGKKEIGTKITLHMADDSQEYLQKNKIQEILEKYCSFIRHPIEFDNKVVNDVTPLWTKNASTLNDKDYQDFYLKLFPFSQNAIFWIHLNVDYPFKLRGVLYFPKITSQMEAKEGGEIKLYCNQVFVADNCKEIIPDYLFMLKGVIDCPDLPLNVSRSYLQTDQTVKKIAEHITKKVADKLSGLCKTERSQFENHWDDIQGFIKYSMLRDEKFYERMLDFTLFKTTDGKYRTLQEYLDQEGKSFNNKIVYVTDETAQASLINIYKTNKLYPILATSMMDSHFIPYIEMRSSKKFTFERLDSDKNEHLFDQGLSGNIANPSDMKTLNEKVQEVFQELLDNKNIKIKVQSFKDAKIPGIVQFNEDTKRLQDMGRIQGAAFMAPITSEQTLVLNNSNSIVKKIGDAGKNNLPIEQLKMLVNQVYDLAYFQSGQVEPAHMEKFIQRSIDILENYSLANTGGNSGSRIII